MHKQMTTVIGQTYDSEIFLHESCIYMDLQKELLERGFDVTVVYDGFYVGKREGFTEADLSDLCCQILQEKSKQYMERYIK